MRGWNVSLNGFLESLLESYRLNTIALCAYADALMMSHKIKTVASGPTRPDLFDAGARGRSPNTPEYERLREPNSIPGFAKWLHRRLLFQK